MSDIIIPTPTTAHQRLIREAMAAQKPVRVPSSLHGYAVEMISKLDAQPIIMHYEWLRSMGSATVFVGLLSPERELQGVACFGKGPGGPIEKTFGQPAWCLERGACVHYAPPNAASFLITHATKLVARVTGVPLFYAYADPMAGEYGAVYQACNWTYLGQGLNGWRSDRKSRYFVLAPGRDPNNAAHWQTSHALRRSGYRGLGSFAKARAGGWRIATRAAKHVYAIHVRGLGRRQWRRAFPGKPFPVEAYPAPERKLKRQPEPGRVVFRVASPPVQLDLFSVASLAAQ